MKGSLGIFWKGSLGVLLSLTIHGVAIGGGASQVKMDDSNPPSAATSPDWKQKLKAQMIIEDTIEGHPTRMSRMDLLQRMAMDQLAHEQHDSPKGAFTAMQGAGHQLDMFNGMMKTGVRFSSPWVQSDHPKDWETGNCQ